MPSTRQRALQKHRQRLEERGLVRLEVLTSKEDRPLLREVAQRLRDDPGSAEDIRAGLRGLLGPVCGPSRKAVLAAMPLDEIDLEREPDPIREIDF